MDDPCDALSTAKIDGVLYYMTGELPEWATGVMVSDPCDDWPVLLIPGVLADLVTAIFKDALDRTVFRDAFMVDPAAYLAKVDMKTVCQPYQRVFADGGTFTPLSDVQTIEMYSVTSRDQARRMAEHYQPQALQCRNGRHRWTAWGNYRATSLPLLSRSWRPSDEPPAPRIEAYRWRHCECGASERESYDDHSIKRFEAER